MAAPQVEPQVAREIPSEQENSVQAIEKKFEDLEVELIRDSTKRHDPIYKERAEIVKKLPDFWAQTFLNSGTVAIYFDTEDAEVFKYLTDFSIERTGANGDPRPNKFHFTFGENPYFSDKVLTKEFVLAENAPALSANFDASEELKALKTSIAWKDDEHNLAAKNPQKGGRDDDDFEPGSFFSCFFESEQAEVSAPIGHGILEDLWPNAVAIYTLEHDESGLDGMIDFEDSDDEGDEDDEDDEDPNAEIDLEDDEPPKKKSKN
ncbi:hypothetical protein K437DRAFT_259212 [Tilletiaria anomala UBC 951]|uniref:Uncharacterized protein n=1 Tax=Tilletiaria anomala (strain ATCC 24038 / CBS 436.72 / UBC 951) TaxID=1037660 RepID=A0A066VK97_TILAU|nr:uncharacterized protein K437DRAFT_259212 [Tilletiaria anomala UBC 951]KDN39010.1 hypothetical protein K437DRAFT_259212 [Tilletiaria anomala UBC 951]